MNSFKNIGESCVYGSGHVYLKEKEYPIVELEKMVKQAREWLNEYSKDNTIENFIREVCLNLPEYAQSLSCTEFNYDDCEYEFYDSEDGKTYKVNIDKLLGGYAKLRELWIGKKVFFGGIKTEEDWRNAGQWDADTVDSLIQCSIFGEIIYG